MLTATRDIRAAALQVHPAALRKTFTLTEAAALAAAPSVEPPSAVELVETPPVELVETPAAETLRTWVRDAARQRATVGPIDYDLVDPIGRDRSTHTAVAAQAEAAVDDLVRKWVSLV